MVATGSPLTERLRATLNRRAAQANAAEIEIAELRRQIIALRAENEMLSFRLAAAEDASVPWNEFSLEAVA